MIADDFLTGEFYNFVPNYCEKMLKQKLNSEFLAHFLVRFCILRKKNKKILLVIVISE